jgi:hypothetical protein
MALLTNHSTRWLLAGALALACVLVPSAASGQARDEYEIKAAFLFNFTKFVEWPPDDETVRTICIYGDDPFGSTIDRLTRGKTVHGRSIEVRRLRQASEATGCHVAFVRSEEREKAAAMLDAVRGRPVLTVSEQGQFGDMGGVVYLETSDHRVEVVISAIAAEAAGLKISAKLMTLATIVGREPAARRHGR